MSIREYERYFPEPSYILASCPYWQRKMRDSIPHSPDDILALLDSEHRLSFQLLSYQNTAAASCLDEALAGAQYHQYSSGRQVRVDESEQETLRQILHLLNGTRGTLCGELYIGAVICRCRRSRNELVVIFGSLGRRTYRSIRLVDIPSELHLRFTGNIPSSSKIEAVDFHLSPNPQTGRLDMRVREHWNIHEDVSVYPWIIRDGHAIPNASKNSCCRDIQVSQVRLNRRGYWMMPVQEYIGVRFESASIL